MASSDSESSDGDFDPSAAEAAEAAAAVGTAKRTLSAGGGSGSEAEDSEGEREGEGKGKKRRTGGSSDGGGSGGESEGEGEDAGGGGDGDSSGGSDEGGAGGSDEEEEGEGEGGDEDEEGGAAAAAASSSSRAASSSKRSKSGREKKKEKKKKKDKKVRKSSMKKKGSTTKKKKGRARVERFLDVEAAEDSEADDEDFLDDDDDVVDARERREAARHAQESERLAPHRDYFNTVMKDLEERAHREGEDDDVIDPFAEDPYDDYPEDYVDDEEGFDPELLRHQPHDPKTWQVNVKANKEREICLSLINKTIDRRQQGIDLQIKTAFTIDTLKGSLYVEAHTPQHVQNALQGIDGVIITPKKPVRMVPPNQIAQLFRMAGSSRIKPVKPKDIVRIKRGVYGGDLAQVFAVHEGTNRVTVKLKPRIDWAELARQEEERHMTKEERAERKKERGEKGSRASSSSRPLARFFGGEAEAERHGVPLDRVARVHDAQLQVTVLRVGPEKFLDSGYVLKRVSMAQLYTGENVKPTMTEMNDFKKDGDKDDDEEEAGLDRMANLTMKSASKGASEFAIGDKVKVPSGALQNLTGLVTSIEGPKVTVKPLNASGLGIGEETFEVDKSEIHKFFQSGDRVRVLSGINEGFAGLIVRVHEGNREAFVHSESAGREITVHFDHMRLATATGQDDGKQELLHFRVGDLISLYPSGDIGMIYFITMNDDIRVLLPSGKSYNATPAQVLGKKNTRTFVVPGADRRPIKGGDSVLVLEGPAKGLTGIVKHVYRNNLFIKCAHRMEYAGYVAVDAQWVRAESKTVRQEALPGGEDGLMDVDVRSDFSRVMRNTVDGSRSAAPSISSKAQPSTKKQLPKGVKWKGRDNFQYKKCVIMTGFHKGKEAIIRSVEPATLKVTLDARPEFLTVNRTDVSIILDKSDKLAARGAATSVGQMDFHNCIGSVSSARFAGDRGGGGAASATAYNGGGGIRSGAGSRRGPAASALGGSNMDIEGVAPFVPRVGSVIGGGAASEAGETNFGVAPPLPDTFRSAFPPTMHTHRQMPHQGPMGGYGGFEDHAGGGAPFSSHAPPAGGGHYGGYAAYPPVPDFPRPTILPPPPALQQASQAGGPAGVAASPSAQQEDGDGGRAADAAAAPRPPPQELPHWAQKGCRVRVAAHGLYAGQLGTILLRKPETGSMYVYMDTDDGPAPSPDNEEEEELPVIEIAPDSLSPIRPDRVKDKEQVLISPGWALYEKYSQRGEETLLAEVLSLDRDRRVCRVAVIKTARQFEVPLEYVLVYREPEVDVGDLTGT
uniref:KOW domain-containing protein n=1 Tax=Chromera velia CCMP2878 TaxID=1169474 RepID=A0A0K6S6K3_9ALVE|eukprot:Cvel_17216.t1-p1 / transcript=Cvel_17216.t1 / gene=Cvel_17216 / organism=Chromera_velia_CCMP2878 / gene_product=Transcription elongation factor SPT5, putative / transcript_product=Transcription elongation factor SPT5, putative / location=Cvel_scaffold1362:4082-23399(+) / protein_length=1293 / sequence_SO=supercontig / SO=protein_coding / is_pseudo=false